jgi:2-keto-4-pentenoate hydratase
MTETILATAQALYQARRNSQPIETVADDWVPQSLPDAYVVQDAVMALEGAAGGWKVLAGEDAAPICSPIPASRFFASGARLDRAAMMIYLAEVEVAVKLGVTMAPKEGAYTSADAEAAIASVHAALEMCATSFAPAVKAPHLLKMADLQSNAAVIVGPASPHPMTADLTSLPVSLSYDGAEVASASTGASWQQILAAVAYLANEAIGRGLTLNAGDVIITGARVKFAADSAHHVQAQVGGLPQVHFELV